MPITSGNYVTPAWKDQAAPPINDDELNAMSSTLEGSQILVGSGAPTSATAGKNGQRYADMSATPPAIYELTDIIPSPIPQAGPYEIGGVVIGYRKNNGAIDYECRVSANENHDIYVLLQSYTNSQINLYAFCKKSNARVTAYEPVGSVTWNLQTRTTDRTWYYSQIIISWTASSAYETVMTVPAYPTFNEMLEVLDSPPTPKWQREEDPNRNLARPYSTGSSYAAGDYCIREGRLWRALEAASGTWDGEKWERAWYADGLSGHVSNRNNPHNVTAAQTGATPPTVIATVQTTTTAVRDYYAGEYFFYDGQLYELKEAVAQGGDLFASGTSETAVLGDGVAALYPKRGTVTLGTFWSGAGPYAQTVTVSGAAVTAKSKIDLLPTAEQLAQLAQDDVTGIIVDNSGGTLTAYAIGAQPSAAMTVKCIVEETI